MGVTFIGLLALVVIVVFSGALWDILHACHVHAWWLFPLLLLGSRSGALHRSGLTAGNPFGSGTPGRGHEDRDCWSTLSHPSA